LDFNRKEDFKSDFKEDERSEEAPIIKESKTEENSRRHDRAIGLHSCALEAEATHGK